MWVLLKSHCTRLCCKVAKACLILAKPNFGFDNFIFRSRQLSQADQIPGSNPGGVTLDPRRLHSAYNSDPMNRWSGSITSLDSNSCCKRHYGASKNGDTASSIDLEWENDGTKHNLHSIKNVDGV